MQFAEVYQYINQTVLNITRDVRLFFLKALQQKKKKKKKTNYKDNTLKYKYEATTSGVIRQTKTKDNIHLLRVVLHLRIFH